MIFDLAVIIKYTGHVHCNILLTQISHYLYHHHESKVGFYFVGIDSYHSVFSHKKINRIFRNRVFGLSDRNIENIINYIQARYITFIKDTYNILEDFDITPPFLSTTHSSLIINNSFAPCDDTFLYVRASGIYILKPLSQSEDYLYLKQQKLFLSSHFFSLSSFKKHILPHINGLNIWDSIFWLNVLSYKLIDDIQVYSLLQFHLPNVSQSNHITLDSYQTDDQCLSQLEKDACLISLVFPVISQNPYVQKNILNLIKNNQELIEIIIMCNHCDKSIYQYYQNFAHQYSSCIKVLYISSDFYSNKITSGLARNLGGSLCRGEWLFYVDEDDEIDIHFIKRIQEVINDLTMQVSFIYIPVKVEDFLIHKTINNFNIQALGISQTYCNANDFIHREQYFSVYNKVLKRDFIEQYAIQCDRFGPYEDKLFLLKTFLYMKQCYVMDKNSLPMYIYYKGKIEGISSKHDKKTSIAKQFLSVRKYIQLFNLIYEIVYPDRKRYLKIRKKFKNRYIFHRRVFYKLKKRFNHLWM